MTEPINDEIQEDPDTDPYDCGCSMCCGTHIVVNCMGTQRPCDYCDCDPGGPVTTFAEARAACISRWGDPTEEHDGKKLKTLPQARWNVGNHEVILTNFPGMALSLCLDMIGAPESEWTLDGKPHAEAPFAELTEALDAIDTLLGRPLP